jgi:fructose-bisphosphate aldolase class II
MAYVSMIPILKKARKEKYAVGAFNILNHLTAKATIEMAEELKSPLIIQTSTSTVKYIGMRELIRFLKPMCEEASVPVAIHLDHCTDKEFAKKCIDAGWSSVMFDGSKLPLEENIKYSSEIAEYAHKKDVSVEGEIGAIFGVEDDIVVSGEAPLASVDGSKKYLEGALIDAFAPAIGTAHGLYKGKPNIHFDLFSEIEKFSPCPLVVHGGTGLEADVFKRLIDDGATKINVSTAIKIAYINGMKKYLNQHPNDLEPLKLDKYISDNVKTTVKEHIALFGSSSRA